MISLEVAEGFCDVEIKEKVKWGVEMVITVQKKNQSS